MDSNVLEAFISRFSPDAKRAVCEATAKFAQCLVRACLGLLLLKRSNFASSDDVIQAEASLREPEPPSGFRKLRDAFGGALFGAGVSNFFVILYDPGIPRGFQILTFSATILGTLLLTDGKWKFQQFRPERLFPEIMETQRIDALKSQSKLSSLQHSTHTFPHEGEEAQFEIKGFSKESAVATREPTSSAAKMTPIGSNRLP